MTHFSPALEGQHAAPYRDALSAAARTAGRRVAVDSLVHLFVHRATACRDAEISVLLDFHRVCVFRPSVDVTLASVVRYLRDDYPISPLEPVLKYAEQWPFRPLHSPQSLSAVGDLLRRCAPQELWTAEMLTGEISLQIVPLHPEVIANGAGNFVSTDHSPFDYPLKKLRVDASLRQHSSRPNAPDDLRVRRHRPVDSPTGLPTFVSEIPRSPAAPLLCYGKAVRRDDASAVCRFEALERFQVQFAPHDAVLARGTHTSIALPALSPDDLMFDVYDWRSNTARTFDECTPIYWTTARSLHDGTIVGVPAQDVWFNTARLPGEYIAVARTTNGCALGGSLTEATLFALLECIERDAFLVMWYLRRQGTAIDLSSVESTGFHLLRHRWRLTYPDYSLVLYDITTEVRVPTVAAFALRVSGSGPHVFCSVAARLTFEQACATALKDLTGFKGSIGDKRRARIAALTPESDVPGLEAHFDTYCTDWGFAQLSFLDPTPNISTDVHTLARASLLPAGEPIEATDVIQTITRHCQSLSIHLYAKDITHADVRARNLHCVRVLPTGLFPMWYGLPARFKVTPRLRRLARETGQAGVDSPSDYNVTVHPFT